MKMKLIAGVVASLALLSAVPASAQQKTVRIGAIYPLSGALASTGAEIKAAVELAVEIVNNPHPELEGIPLAAGSGLPALGGAKIEVVFGDSQGKPEVGLADAQRLIDQEKVVALTGAYQSAVTKTASRIAEQRGIPYLNGESSSPDLTERGYKWFFRTSPNDDTFIENMMQFLDGVKAVPTTKIAVVYENTDFGVNTYKAVEKFAKQYKREVVANIAYSAGSASVTAEVQKLSAAKPDVAIFASYTSDAMLFVRTMRESKYAPPVLLANDAGFIDSRFVQEVGPQVQGVLSRDVWATTWPRQGGAQEDQRHVQGQDGQGPERQQCAFHAGRAGAGRRHQPGRFHRSRGDPQGAGRDRLGRIAGGHALGWREVRRQGAEHQGRRPDPGTEGRRLPDRVAGEVPLGQEPAHAAVQLEISRITCKQRRAVAPAAGVPHVRSSRQACSTA